MSPALPPQVQIEGDRAEGVRHVKRALDLLAQTKARAGHLAVFRGHLRLSDTVYCHAIIAGDVEVARIVVESPGEAAEAMPLVEGWQTPDFLSGVVIGGAFDLDKRHCVGFWPAPECARLMYLNAANRAGPSPSHRLAVATHTEMADAGMRYAERYGTYYAPTQCAEIRPTQYTGTMRKLVQFLLGVGRPVKRSIYHGTQTGGADAPGVRPALSSFERDKAKHGLQVRYDFRFHRTHGVIKAADGRWWLVEIGEGKGLSAFPLPLYPETQQPGFDSIVDDLNDACGQAVMDLFGGLPTGEQYPSGDAFDAWVRAGRVIRSDTDMAAFYAEYIPFSTVCGWAFNESGTAAHITAYHYTEPHGLCESIHFSLALRIGSSRPKPGNSGIGDIAAALATQKSGNASTFPAAMYKLSWLDNGQADTLRAMIASGDKAGAYAWLDALVISPLAELSAPLAEVSKGYLWAHMAAVPAAQNQLKFPVPELAGLVTFDMRPKYFYDIPTHCDTPVYVFFNGDDLHVVKYFLSPVMPVTNQNDNYEPCMYAGQWSYHEEVEKAPAAMFYTNTIDNRQDICGRENWTDTTGVDLGYTSVAFEDDINDHRYCTVRRTKTFMLHTKTVVKTGGAVKSSILIPFGDRCAYYYAEWVGCESITTHEGWRYERLGDPNYGRGFRVLGRYMGGADRFPECGNPSARRVYMTGYDGTECMSAYADSGEWLSKCDDIDAMSYDSPLPDLPPNTVASAPGGKFTAVLVCANAASPITVAALDNLSSWTLEPVYDWFRPSPDPLVLDWKAFLETTHNVLGSRDTLVYSPSPNGGWAFIGGPINGGMDKMLTFIGVVD